MAIATEILKIQNIAQAQAIISRASQILREGGLVAFPTETVYGLGANALLEDSIKRIYEVKGRSFKKPLTYHLPSVEAIEPWVKSISPTALKLMEKFLPGPVTLIFQKSEKVSDLITAGSNKVGIRVPSHAATKALLIESQVPVVATSANISGKPTSTNFIHVLEDLDGKIEAAIDSKDLPLGMESTVIDVTVDPPRILRLGFVTIEEIAGTIGIHPLLSENHLEEEALFRYSLKPRLYLFVGERKEVHSRIMEKLKELGKGKRIGIMAREMPDAEELKDVLMKNISENYLEAAAELFASIRSFEEKGAEVILVEGVGKEGLGATIMDRLEKIAYEVIKV